MRVFRCTISIKTKLDWTIFAIEVWIIDTYYLYFMIQWYLLLVIHDSVMSISSFKYLGSVISNKGFQPEIFSETAQTTAALTRLKPLWNDRSISLSSKIRLMRTLVISIFLMLVNHGPSRQSSKEEYKPWEWGATARYYTSHTKTMLQTRKSVPRSSRHSDFTKTYWPL